MNKSHKLAQAAVLRVASLWDGGEESARIGYAASSLGELGVNKVTS